MSCMEILTLSENEVKMCEFYEDMLRGAIAKAFSDHCGMGGDIEKIKEHMIMHVIFAKNEQGQPSHPHVRFPDDDIARFEAEQSEEDKAFIVIMPLTPGRTFGVRLWESAPFGCPDSGSNPEGRLVNVPENHFIMLPANCVHTEEVPDADTLYSVMVVVPKTTTVWTGSGLVYDRFKKKGFLSEIYGTSK